MRSALTSLALVSLAFGCGEEAPAHVELPPLVGALELPISLRSDGNAGTSSVAIEASTNEIRLGGQVVYTGLERGRLPATARAQGALTELLAHLRAAPAAAQANLTLAGMVPYETTVRILETLETAGYRTVAFAVRPIGSTGGVTTGWLTLTDVATGPAEGPIQVGGAPRAWSDFTSAWSSAYEACRAGRYIDCDGAPTTPSVGGELQLVLWSRGQGMQLRFNQVNAPEVAAPSAPAHVELIEGVPAQAAGAPEEAPPADTSGVFSFRYEEATRTETNADGTQVAQSAITATTRPVCGAAVCPTIIETDAETPTMRVLSFVGAAFPNGSMAPRVVFRRTDR